MILGHPVPVSDDLPGVSGHHQGQYPQVDQTHTDGMHRYTDGFDKEMYYIFEILNYFDLSNQG